MLKKLAFSSIIILALILRMAPYLKGGAIMGADPYYHMRLIQGLFLVDHMYAGSRTALYPPLFHLLMGFVPGSLVAKAILIPPLLSTLTVPAAYFLLREHEKEAFLASFLIALNPALLMRVYFFPELLAIFVAPFFYYALIKDNERLFAILGVVLCLTHVFSALFYFASALLFSTNRRMRVLTAALLFMVIVFAFIQGPSLDYVRRPFLLPFFVCVGIYVPLASIAMHYNKNSKGLFFFLALFLVLCILLPQEVATYRIPALGAVILCIVAGTGMLKVAQKSTPMFFTLLVLFLAIGIMHSMDRSPIYSEQDVAGVSFLGENSLMPVMSTAGHLATYYGSTVLVDEYYPYSPDHGKRLSSQTGIILMGSKDYRVPEAYGISHIYVESSVPDATIEHMQRIYDSKARIYFLEYEIPFY